MIDGNAFLEQLQKEGVTYVTGVPDSLLSAFSACLLNQDSEPARKMTHVIAANEGNAAALAAGHYLATGEISLVYMQNSGIGNMVNPAVSLLHPEVYGIPILFLVGWRGEPGTKDEPQHMVQGRITEKLLETMEIPCELLSREWGQAQQQLKNGFAWMKEHSRSYALLVSKDTFTPCPLQKKGKEDEKGSVLLREEAIAELLEWIPEDAFVVSTTGKCSRELFELREGEKKKTGETSFEEGTHLHEKDFLTVGSMGHASSIAMGAAAGTSHPVVCLDGDGAALMHMGAMAVLGQSGCSNLVHIVLNNGAHESVGGQPTVAGEIVLTQLAQACGYASCYRVNSREQMRNVLQPFLWNQGPVFIEVEIGIGSRKDLGRPTVPPQENKKAVMQFLKKEKKTKW